MDGRLSSCDTDAFYDVLSPVEMFEDIFFFEYVICIRCLGGNQLRVMAIHAAERTALCKDDRANNPWIIEQAKGLEA